MFRLHCIILAFIILSYTYFIFDRDKIQTIKIQSGKKRRLGRQENDKQEETTNQEPDRKTLDSVLNFLKTKRKRFYIYFCYYYSYSLQAWLTFKYAILNLVSYEQYKQYRFMSCILMGRFSVNARVVDMLRVYIVILSLFHLIWRFVMITLRPNFHFDVLKFLLLKRSEVIKYETLSQIPINKYRSSVASFNDPDNLFLNDTEKIESSSTHYYVPLLHYRIPSNHHNINDSSDKPVDQFKIRPNRTLKAWDEFFAVSSSYISGTLIPLLLQVCGVLVMSSPMLFTNNGFKLSYQECMSWISNQSNQTNYYSFIYEPKQNETFEVNPELKRSMLLPYEGFVDLSKAYQRTRLFADIIESLLIMVELVAAFVINPCFAILMSTDVIFYAESIKTSLKTYIFNFQSSRLEEDSSTSKSLLSTDYIYQPSATLNANHDPYTAHTAAVLDIQAMLSDLIALIGSYRKYASFFTVHTIALWLTYSSTGFSFLIIPGSIFDSSKFEWSFVLLLSTSYVIIVVGAFARVRVVMRSLYPLIGTAAALECKLERDLGCKCVPSKSCLDSQTILISHPSDSEWRQRRWQIILDYFSGSSPMYCFVSVGHVEISWSFLMKLITWLFSVLFIVSYYLTMYK